MKLPSDRRQGFTLVGVLVFCLILIPVCASVAQSSRDFARATRGDLDALKRELLASGIAEAVAARIGSDRLLADRVSGKSLACTIADDQVTVTVRDHDGKIDLNNAGSELLVAGFEAVGLESQAASLLQQFTEASRSNGTLPREISELVEKVSLKHAPFEHADELQDALAALGLPAADLVEYFTVNRGVANIERSTAPATLQAALRTLSNQGVVFEDNGTFDYADVLVDVRSMRDGRGVSFARTYRKISPMGDVIEIQKSKLLAGFSSLPRPATTCAEALGFGGES